MYVYLLIMISIKIQKHLDYKKAKDSTAYSNNTASKQLNTIATNMGITQGMEKASLGSANILRLSTAHTERPLYHVQSWWRC